MIPFLPGYFYYVTLALQAICVIHCLRKGNQQKWIYIIVFLPLIGCVDRCLFSEGAVCGGDPVGAAAV